MVNAEIIKGYFPDLTSDQFRDLKTLYPVYEQINSRINLISRKDFANFYIHHVLHSLALGAFCTFPAGKRVIDIGTGGGFPGIPLAIFFPEVHFTLVDSIGKKIRAVDEVVEILNLKNVTTLNTRTESLNSKFDIAVARAVAPMSELWMWMDGKWTGKPVFYLLKGGDLHEEMNDLLQMARGTKFGQHMIIEKFNEPFFETKKVIELHGR